MATKRACSHGGACMCPEEPFDYDAAHCAECGGTGWVEDDEERYRCPECGPAAAKPVPIDPLLVALYQCVTYLLQARAYAMEGEARVEALGYLETLREAYLAPAPAAYADPFADDEEDPAP